MQCNVIQYNIMQYQAIPYTAIPYTAMPNTAMPYHAIPYNTMQWHKNYATPIRYLAPKMNIFGNWGHKTVCRIGCIFPKNREVRWQWQLIGHQRSNSISRTQCSAVTNILSRPRGLIKIGKKCHLSLNIHKYTLLTFEYKACPSVRGDIIRHLHVGTYFGQYGYFTLS